MSGDFNAMIDWFKATDGWMCMYLHVGGWVFGWIIEWMERNGRERVFTGSDLFRHKMEMPRLCPYLIWHGYYWIIVNLLVCFFFGCIWKWLITHTCPNRRERSVSVSQNLTQTEKPSEKVPFHESHAQKRKTRVWIKTGPHALMWKATLFESTMYTICFQVMVCVRPDTLAP